MAKTREWNIITETGESIRVTLEKKQIIVNGNTPIALKTAKSTESSILETVYDIPLGNGEIAKLCIGTFDGKYVLVYNGTDVETGLEHKIADVPKWIFIFVALYVINFFVVLGGALGGAIAMAALAASARIAANQEKSKAFRYIMCILIYVGVTIVSLIIAFGVGSLLNRLR